MTTFLIRYGCSVISLFVIEKRCFYVTVKYVVSCPPGDRTVNIPTDITLRKVKKKTLS